jgi:hypothetical protein
MTRHLTIWETHIELSKQVITTKSLKKYHSCQINQFDLQIMEATMNLSTRPFHCHPIVHQVITTADEI